MRFPVVLHFDDGVRYGVTVPDLPGCFSSGDTFDAALDSMLEAIDLQLEGLVEEGMDIPVAHAIAEHRANADFADGVGRQWRLILHVLRGAQRRSILRRPPVCWLILISTRRRMGLPAPAFWPMRRERPCASD